MRWPCAACIGWLASRQVNGLLTACALLTSCRSLPWHLCLLQPSGDRKRKPPQAPGLGRLASVPSTLTTLPSYSSAQLQQQVAQQEQQQLMALMAGMGASFPSQQKQQGSGAGAGSEPALAQQPSANLTAGDMAGLAALAAGLLRGTPAEADATRTAARLAAAATGSTRLPDLRSQPSPNLASLAAAAAASAPAPSGGTQQQAMLMQLLQSQASLGGALAGSGGGSGDARSAGAFRAPSTAAKAEPNPAPGLEGVEFLLDCLRCGWENGWSCGERERSSCSLFLPRPVRFSLSPASPSLWFKRNWHRMFGLASLHPAAIGACGLRTNSLLLFCPAAWLARLIC